MQAYIPLRMIAEDQEDLTLISACLQDALIPLSGIEYDKENRYFHLIANRFCWEHEEENREEGPCYNRVVAGLSFHNVRNVSKQGLNLENQNELLNLLTITFSDDNEFIHLVFSGGASIKVEIEKTLLCHLKDLESPYPTLNKPIHD
jgi:hypothetical protein